MYLADYECDAVTRVIIDDVNPAAYAKIQSMTVDQNDSETLLMLLANSGCHYVMGLPQADDIMLMYQSTGFHDVAAVRELFHKRPIRAFEAWMEGLGIWKDGRLTELAGDPTIFL